MAGDPRLGGPRPPPRPLEIAGLLPQPILGALVIVEHRRLEGEVDELAHAPQRRLGVEDQVLEADLEIVVQPGRLLARSVDPPPPVLRRLRHRIRPPLEAEQRDRHVAPVADQMHEAGLG
jgi:hypothetical protein